MDFNAYAIANIMCARCEARPGDPCVSITGRRSPRPHAARTTPLYAADRNGYVAAYTELADRLERSIAAGDPIGVVAEHVRSIADTYSRR